MLERSEASQSGVEIDIYPFFHFVHQLRQGVILTLTVNEIAGIFLVNDKLNCTSGCQALNWPGIRLSGLLELLTRNHVAQSKQD